MNNVIKKSRGDAVLDIIISAILVCVTFLVLYPLYYILIASISDPSAVALGEVVLFPIGINFDAYIELWSNTRIWTGYRNSLIYTAVGTFLNIAITIPAGFALAKKQLPGRKLIMLYFVFTMYFSGGMMPKYLVVSDLNLINTPWAVLLPSAISVFYLIICKSYFEGSIPESLYDAAYIDGCNNFKFFFIIALPLAPALIAVMVLYYALIRWNAYLEPMIYITDEAIQTLQVIINSIMSAYSASNTEGMSQAQLTELLRTRELLKYAIVVVAMLPLLIAYPFVQKYFIRGVMVGAVKE